MAGLKFSRRELEWADSMSGYSARRSSAWRQDEQQDILKRPSWFGTIRSRSAVDLGLIAVRSHHRREFRRVVHRRAVVEDHGRERLGHRLMPGIGSDAISATAPSV